MDASSLGKSRRKKRQTPEAMNVLKPSLIPAVIREHLLDRRLAHVHRWGTTPLVKEKSVAEHSFFVARIARRICALLMTRRAQVGEINILKVVDMALMHDEAEAFSGDIVRPFKTLSSELEELIEKRASSMLQEVYASIPDGDYFMNLCEEFKRKESLEAQIVDVADNMAASAEGQEEAQFGNQRFSQGQFPFSRDSFPYPWVSLIKDWLPFSGV